MTRRSAISGARRQLAPRLKCRARFAPWVHLFCELLLAAAIAARPATAQTPEVPRPPAPTLSPPATNGASQPAAVPALVLPAPEPTTRAATAKSPPGEDLKTILDRPGDLDLHNLSLNKALFTISELWNVNIVAGELQGTVNGVFKQAPLREILDSILLSNGYNYREVGKSLVVSSVASLGQGNPSVQSATIPVQTADIDEVVEGARLLITPQGKVQALKSARSIVVVDFPDRVRMVREFVRSLENNEDIGLTAPGSRVGRPLEVGYFHTQYIKAKSAEQALTAVLSKSGRVGVMEHEDRLLVSDYAENLAMVEKALEKIDHPRPQVRITALIYDISLQDIEQLGLNLKPTGKARINSSGDAQSTLGVDSVMQVPFEAGSAGSTLTFMNLSRHLDLTAVVLALQGTKDARLMGNPNVSVLENDEAIFQSVSEIPYQQLTQTSQGGNIGTTSFKEAGITLKVRPKIAADGTIEMLVTPEFSRLAGFTPGDNQPIIDKRTATTSLRVCDRQTFVIGGLRQRSDVGDFKGVPYLKDIPGVGRAFRSRDTDVRESELVVFIMPEIVGYDNQPQPRDQMVADTVNCRLDRIPWAEGCAPECKRLPFDPAASGPHNAPYIEMAPQGMPQNGGPIQMQTSMQQLPPAPPRVAGPPPAGMMQVGPAVGPPQSLAPQVQTPQQMPGMVSDGRVRRLPVVMPTQTQPVVAESGPRRSDLFSAPPATLPSQRPSEARRAASGFEFPR